MRYGNRRRGGGGENVGGFLKEAPKPPRTFLEFVFDRTNTLRQSHAGSLFQSQFNAARVQPPDTCMTGATGNAGGKPSPGACFSGSACAASGSVPGYLHGKVCKCRKRSNAGVPGAVAPGKIILESPPSPPGKSVLRARVGGISFPFGEGGRIKTKGGAGRRPKRQAAHANITAAVSTGNVGGKPPPGACFSGSASAANGQMPGCLHDRVCKCRKRFNAGDARGEAPCMK